MFGHPRELEAFGNYKGLVLFFRKVSRCNWTFYQSENFSYSSLHHTFESQIFENYVKMWKIKLQKIIGNFFDMIRKMYLNGMLT